MLAPLCCLAALVLVACSRGGVSSPQGDPSAAQRAAAAESRPSPGVPAQQEPRKPSLLSGNDLSLAYKFILDNYVDHIDHVQLIDAANSAIRTTVHEAGALPLDSAALDFLPLASGNPDRDWYAFSTAYDAVIQRHPEWSLGARLDYQAAREMLRSLDDNHSTFISADDARRRAETSYSGIGVRIARLDPQGPPVVVHVFRSSPAAQAGLRAGDRIVGVGDRPVVQLPLNEVAELIRGPQNSDVSLLMERTLAGGPFNVRIPRRPPSAPDAEGEVLDGKLGYIRIYAFGPNVAERVGALLVEQDQQGVQSWILDLRSNPGGSLEEVRKVAGYFMDPRPIGIAVDRAGDRQAIPADTRPRRLKPQTALVLLIDGDSGSGAEVLASAFKEYQLATLVGQKTSGSVGIATSRQLSDGSAVQLTISRLLTPAGSQIDRVGVQPDEVVPLAAGDLEAGRDPQRERAIQILRQLVAR